MTTFRDPNVYVKSKELVKQVCELLKKFPCEEQFSLSEQLLINEGAKMLSVLIAKRKQPVVQRPRTYSAASSKQ